MFADNSTYCPVLLRHNPDHRAEYGWWAIWTEDNANLFQWTDLAQTSGDNHLIFWQIIHVYRDVKSNIDNSPVPAGFLQSWNVTGYSQLNRLEPPGFYRDLRYFWPALKHLYSPESSDVDDQSPQFQYCNFHSIPFHLWTSSIFLVKSYYFSAH